VLYLDDPDWTDYLITEVTTGPESYGLMFREPHEERGGMGVGLPIADFVAAGVEAPQAGDALRLCGSLGRPIRGAIVRGQLVYYRTPAEEHDRHAAEVLAHQAERRRAFEETGRAALDAKYAALPPVFQARIDKFRHNNPDFRWEYEDYEMFCCEEAVKLARHLGTIDAAEHYASLAASETWKADNERWNREWEEQKAIDRAAGLADGHSGNTHGMAVALAFWYLKHPENVERMHGALAPLVGSFEYGCVPPDKAD
jgi:hypothetical protein